MAGKHFTGIQTNNAGTIKDARAHCEGREAAANGGVIGDNPHESPSDAWFAWDVGFVGWTLNPGNANTIDNCALPFGGGFV